VRWEIGPRVRDLTLLRCCLEGRTGFRNERLMRGRGRGLGKYPRDWVILGCCRLGSLGGLYRDPILKGLHCSTRRRWTHLAVLGSVGKTWLGRSLLSLK
jgi:hypothetical protein